MLLLALLALALTSYLFLYKRDVQAPIMIEESTDNVRMYNSSAYGLSFSYSPSLYLKERDTPNNRPQLSLVLVEDTVENRNVLEGRSTVAREGPVSITVEVYPNPDKLPAEDWVRSDTNWTVRTSDAAPIGRGEITGVTYSWSGLYEGKSVIVTEGGRAYVFSVTWLTPEDTLLAEFDRLLASVVLAP